MGTRTEVLSLYERVWKAKVWVSGRGKNSKTLAITIPKKLADFFNISEGDIIIVKLVDIYLPEEEQPKYRKKQRLRYYREVL